MIEMLIAFSKQFGRYLLKGEICFVGVLFSFSSALSFAVSHLVMRKGMQKSGNDSGYFLSLMCNAVVLTVVFLVVVVLRSFHLEFNWFAFSMFFVSGILTTGFGRMSLLGGIRRIGPSRTSAIKNGAPLFTILFALLILGEQISWGPAIGIAVILLAIVLQGVKFFFSQNEINKEMTDVQAAGINRKVFLSDSGIGSEWGGYLLAVLSALFFGIGQFVRKMGLIHLNDPYMGAWIGVMASLLFYVICEAVRGQLKQKIKENFSYLNPYFLAGGVLMSMGPLFFFLGASITQVSYVSVVAAAEPVLTVLLSSLVMRRQERLTASVWITAFLVLVGASVIALSG